MDMIRWQKRGRIAFGLVAMMALTGCGSGMFARTAAEPVLPAPEAIASSVPDAVVQVWEEPMVDIVDVPAGLDPEGHYYRPRHRQVLEVRQGRWQIPDRQE